MAALEAEVARLSQPETDADLIKRLERVFPVLVQRQDSRAVKNMPGVARPAYPSDLVRKAAPADGEIR